jgi:hypothetical protein
VDLDVRLWQRQAFTFEPESQPASVKRSFAADRWPAARGRSAKSANVGFLESDQPQRVEMRRWLIGNLRLATWLNCGQDAAVWCGSVRVVAR